MATSSPLKSRYNFSTVALILTLAPATQAAQPSIEPLGPRALIEQRAEAARTQGHERGLAYAASGLATLAVAITGYYLADDLLVRGIYSGAQILGVAAVGYGAYLYGVDDDDTRAAKWIAFAMAHPGQDDALARFHLEESAQRAKTMRTIRVVGHGLTAALNGLSAVTCSDAELRHALLFLGAINVVASVGLSLFPSAAEELLEQIAH